MSELPPLIAARGLGRGGGGTLAGGARRGHRQRHLLFGHFQLRLQGGHAGFGLGDFGANLAVVQLGQHLAGADAVALAHQHARQLAGKLARHQHMVALDAAIGLHQAFGQLAALGAPVQAGGRQHGQRQQQGNQ